MIQMLRELLFRRYRTDTRARVTQRRPMHVRKIRTGENRLFVYRFAETRRRETRGSAKFSS